MSGSTDTFFELYLAGKIHGEEIHEFIDRWHEGSDPRELHEFLGMTREEYRVWVERPEMLQTIVFARKQKHPLKDVIGL